MRIYRLNEDGTAEIIGAPDFSKVNAPPPQSVIPPSKPVNMKLPPYQGSPSNMMHRPEPPNRGMSSHEKVLPAPPYRSSYGYHIVPYYVPVNYYSSFPPYYTVQSQRYRDMMTMYPSSFYGGQNVINREYAYGEFDFTDDTPGLFACQGDFYMSAGSADGRVDVVKVRLNSLRYIKFCKSSKQARLVFSELLNALYYDRSQLTNLLVKYDFEEYYVHKN